MHGLFSQSQQRQGGDSPAKEKAKEAQKQKKNKRSPRKQNPGQPSGPDGSVSTSEQSKAGNAVNGDEETPRANARDQAKPAKVSKAASYTVRALHAIDIGLGLALIIYGGTISVAQVTAASVCYGLVLFLGAVAGTVGICPGACNRRGLLVSAVAGLFACLLDLAAFILVLVSWDTFIKFLHENRSELNLSKDSVNTIDGLKILFMIIFIVLAILEGYRFGAMWVMEDNRKSKNESKCNWFLSLFGAGKRKKTDDFVVFDENATMEDSLLWSQDGTVPSSDDYLEFVPEHERKLEEFTTSVTLPKPPEDKMDY